MNGARARKLKRRHDGGFPSQAEARKRGRDPRGGGRRVVVPLTHGKQRAVRGAMFMQLIVFV